MSDLVRITEMFENFRKRLDRELKAMTRELAEIRSTQNRMVERLDRISGAEGMEDDLEGGGTDAIAVGMESLGERIAKNSHVIDTINDNVIQLMNRESPKTVVTHVAKDETKASTVENAAGKDAETVDEQSPKTKKEAIQEMNKYLNKSKNIYDVKLLNCFITSVSAVIEASTSVKVKFIKPDVKIEEYHQPFIVGVMALAGMSGSGKIGVGFKKETIIAIANKMFGFEGKEKDEVTIDLAEDLAKELCNQICGQAKVELAKRDFKFEMSMPEVICSFRDEKVDGKPKIALYFLYDNKYDITVEFWT